MSVLRRVIAGMALAVALVLLAGAAAPYAVDGGTVRDQLIAKLSAWAGGNLRVEGDVRLTSLFDLAIEAQDVRIDGPERFPKVAQIEVDALAARVNLWALLTGRIVFDKVWVDGPTIRLRERYTETMPDRLWRAVLLDDGGALSRLTDAARDAPFSFIEFTDARVVPAGPRDAADGEAQDPFTVIVERQTSGAVTVSGWITRKPELARFALTRGAFRPAGPTLEAPVRLTTESESTGRVSVEGRIIRANGARFAGDLEVRDAPLHVLADWLDLPAGDAVTDRTYSATAALEATATTISLQEVDVEIGQTRANGLLNLELDGERPKLSGTLGLSAVDLRGFSISGPSNGIFLTEDPRSLRRGGLSLPAWRVGEWLGEFDADLRLSADRLRFDGLTTGEAAAFLSVAGGNATLDVAGLMVFDGVMNGQFSVRWADRAFRLSGKGNATGIDLERLLTTARAPLLASGPADISFAVDGAGPTLSAVTRGMKVSGQLMALRGGDMALDVAAMAARAREDALNGERARASLQMASRRAQYDMLRASFILRDRDLRLAPVKIAQDGWIIRGRGRADLAQHRLDCRLDAARMPVGGPAQSGLSTGANASPAENRAISLHLKGSLQRPWVAYTMPDLPLSSVEGNASWWP